MRHFVSSDTMSGLLHQWADCLENVVDRHSVRKADSVTGPLMCSQAAIRWDLSHPPTFRLANECGLLALQLDRCSSGKRHKNVK